MRTERLLLSEGSSLSSRQAITALGQAGYLVDLCDPDPLCLGRFSRFVRRFFRSPALGRDPLGYLQFIVDHLATEPCDVLLPVHEQAFLFARVRKDLGCRVGLALPDFDAFVQVQSKLRFFQVLAELAIPHPRTQVVRSETELRACTRFPCFLKTEYGTASVGVWAIERTADLDAALDELRAREELDGRPLLVQERVAGKLERIQTVFDTGRLVAWHGYAQRLEGPGGGDTAKTSVVREAARDHVARLGEHLVWHGALSLDYFFEEASGRLWFIDGNPRLVEPMNGVFSGVNLAEVLVRVSRGEHPVALGPGRAGVRTHMTIMALLDTAAQEGSRIAVLRRLIRALRHRGEFSDSREELTPVGLDPRSGGPALIVLARLLADPRGAAAMASQAIRSYSLSAKAVEVILGLEPIALQRGFPSADGNASPKMARSTRWVGT